MHPPARFLRHCLALLGVALLLAGTGCTDDARQSYATETDEPYYRQGEQMKRASRHQEALSAYLKVIEKRGDDAPESHLEAGLIYLHHIRDPIAAIYHFRKFLALRPNSAQAALVRQRIDAAMRDFARTLPAQPVESQLQRVDLMAALDKAKLENDLLKRQLAEYQAGREPAATTEEGEVGSSTAQSAPSASGAGNFALNLDALPTVRTRPQQTTRPPAPTSAAATPQTRPAPTNQQTARQQDARPAARRHTVRPGDTLSKLSQQYYGNRSRWREIFQANRNVMRNESDLKVGVELVIP
ncbi:MAG: LysM peptidoglycan-binding domain-containing protein [Candidatus Didemnitutus sp.]|nr:LysM peptidoglycan-binding domain-containing protein [Candidatus Didemnitutus sp.]